MTKTRNIMVVAMILVVGMGIIVATNDNGIVLALGGGISIKLTGVFIATVIGIVLNALLPKVKNEIRNFGAPEDLKRAEAGEKAAAKAAKSQHKK